MVTVNVKPFTSNRLPVCILILLMVTLLANFGYLGAPVGMITLPAAKGTPPAQLPAVFQSVLAAPVHVWQKPVLLSNSIK